MKLDPRPPFRSLRGAFARPIGTVRERPRLAAGLALVVLLVILGGAWLAVGRTPAKTAGPTGPTFTFSGGWTLVELQRHIEAGDVEAITATTSGSPLALGPTEQLLARTKSGQVVPVDLAVSPGEAVDALSAMGYGKLLTDEAMSVSAPATSGDGPSLLSVALPIAMLVVMALFVLRLSRRTGPAQRDTASFRTIMPATPSTDAASGAAIDGAAAGAATSAIRLSD